jgi:hypothetical protein
MAADAAGPENFQQADEPKKSSQLPLPSNTDVHPWEIWQSTIQAGAKSKDLLVLPKLVAVVVPEIALPLMILVCWSVDLGSLWNRTWRASLWMVFFGIMINHCSLAYITHRAYLVQSATYRCLWRCMR